MLLEEEKKAIERVKDTFYEMPLEDFKSITLYRDSIKDVFILLTSFEKLQEENEVLKRALDNETADRSNDLLELQKKDKMIDLMAEELQTHMFVVSVGKTIIGKKGIKEYYEQKATNDV